MNHFACQCSPPVIHHNMVLIFKRRFSFNRLFQSIHHCINIQLIYFVYILAIQESMEVVNKDVNLMELSLNVYHMKNSTLNVYDCIKVNDNNYINIAISSFHHYSNEKISKYNQKQLTFNNNKINET
eukprot:167897_1